MEADRLDIQTDLDPAPCSDIIYEGVVADVVTVASLRMEADKIALASNQSDVDTQFMLATLELAATKEAFREIQDSLMREFEFRMSIPTDALGCIHAGLGLPFTPAEWAAWHLPDPLIDGLERYMCLFQSHRDLEAAYSALKSRLEDSTQ